MEHLGTGMIRNGISLSHRIHVWYICYSNIWGILMVNVTIYSIHGSYGYVVIWVVLISCPSKSPSESERWSLTVQKSNLKWHRLKHLENPIHQVFPAEAQPVVQIFPNSDHFPTVPGSSWLLGCQTSRRAHTPVTTCRSYRGKAHPCKPAVKDWTQKPSRAVKNRLQILYYVTLIYWCEILLVPKSRLLNSAQSLWSQVQLYKWSDFHSNVFSLSGN